MSRIKANGIEIEYETFGSESLEPLLLVMGLGGQLTLWHEDLCRALVDRGHFVIRYDNRDVGLSTKFDAAGVPNLLEIAVALQQGQQPEAPYSLDDMADDAAGLLDGLGLDSAHVCGASMGGMIAQTLAIRHPARVRSLVSIMSSTGNPDLPQAKPEVMAKLMAPPPPDRDAAIEQSVDTWRTIGSPGFVFDEDFIRERAARDYDRCYSPGGTARQSAAIVAHGSRRDALGRVAVPTLVIHGADDPLVPVEGGHDTAQAIPGAELLIIEGMGHDMPVELHDRLADAIAGTAKRAS